ncbi:phage tail protein [Glutamicibacter soli]
MSSYPRATTAPYLRLGAEAGWEPRLGSERLVSDGGTVRLGHPGIRPIADGEPFGSLGGRTLVRGLAIGPDGELLLADPDARVIRIARQPVPGIPADPADPLPALWPVRPAADAPHDPYALLRPVDLAFTPHGDLLIADAAARRLLVLAYPHGALRAVISLPGWEPGAVAVDAAGRCYVADRAGLHGSGATVHRFDAHWRRSAHYPHPGTVLAAPWQLAVAAGGCGCAGGCAGGCNGGCNGGCAGGCNSTPGCTGDSGCTTTSGRTPVLVVADGSGLLVLDDRGRVLPAGTPIPELAEPALLADPDGTLSWEDPGRPHHDPLRFPGLRIDRTGREPDTGLPVVALPARLRLPQAGVLRLGPLVGDGPGFAWDRLVLDAQIPPGTAVLVRVLASDAPAEPGLADGSAASWSRAVKLEAQTPTELLVPGPAGQHLWIELELRGTGYATPQLRRLDVHAPRRSSLRRLPPGYRQDPVSANFLDRFLSYFDTVFAEVQAEHRDAALLLDERTAPAGAALDWLGSWFGLDFHPSWPVSTRRRAISEAMAYSMERGSIPGLKRLLGWHTGLPAPWPAVIEHFRLTDQAPPVGRAPLPAPGAAHRCTVVLPESAAPDAAQRQELSRLLDAHLPAHVRAEVRYIRPGIVIGAQSSIAVDTLLGGAPHGALGTAQLAIDTHLCTEPHPTPSLRSNTPC